MTNIRDARPKIPPAPADARSFCVNPARGNIRKVDFNLFPKGAVCGQLLYESETLAVVLSRNPPHTRGAQAHKHAQDQFYCTLSGELKVEMGTELHTLRPGSVAHIPAGTPHQNWNDGDVEELHLELMVPGFSLGTASAEFVDENSAWAPGGSVAHLPHEKEWHSEGFKVFAYSEPSGAFKPALPESRSAMIMVNRQMPDAVSVIDNRHVHRFDQHYYVTEGTMQLDIALDRYEVGPHMLAIVPAGVPHCNRMIGSVPESHIIINVPAPLPAAAGGKEVAKYLATKVIFEAAPKDR